MHVPLLLAIILARSFSRVTVAAYVAVNAIDPKATVAMNFATDLCDREFGLAFKLPTAVTPNFGQISTTKEVVVLASKRRADLTLDASKAHAEKTAILRLNTEPASI